MLGPFCMRRFNKFSNGKPMYFSTITHNSQPKTPLGITNFSIKLFSIDQPLMAPDFFSSLKQDQGWHGFDLVG